MKTYLEDFDKIKDIFNTTEIPPEPDTKKGVPLQ